MASSLKDERGFLLIFLIKIFKAIAKFLIDLTRLLQGFQGFQGPAKTL